MWPSWFVAVSRSPSGSLTAVGPTAVQAGLPCPLWEPFPSHPIVLLQTSGFSVFFCMDLCLLFCSILCCLLFFWVFVYFCSVFPSELLYCWLGLFSAFDPYNCIPDNLLVETLNTAQSVTTTGTMDTWSGYLAQESAIL